MNQSDDCSLLIGLLTAPFSREKEFYDHEIKEVFRKYKKKQFDYHSSIQTETKTKKPTAVNDFEEALYEPNAYCIFGNYDLAVISLIDDYTLTNRNFHPYSYFVNEKYEEHSEKFKYKIITGTTRQLNETSDDSNLIDKAKKTFLSKSFNEKAYPFIGISRLKVNSGILIGNGVRFTTTIQKAIRKVLAEIDSNTAKNIDFIITESFGWNELNVLFFSDSFRDISETIVKIREFRFEDLMDHCDDTTYKELIKASLINDLIQSENKKGKNYSIEESHIFIKSLTSYGYDLDLLGEGTKINDREIEFSDNFYEPKLDQENLRLLIKWGVKLGHTDRLLKGIDESKVNFNDHSISFISGNEDYIFPVAKNNGEIGIKDSFLTTRNLIINSGNHQIANQVRKLTTIPTFNYSLEELKEIIKNKKDADPKRHFSLSQHLTDYAFSLEQLGEIRTMLYKCRVSKILREKILKIFVNYNEGIRDPILFIYFIELRPFLKKLKNQIALYYKKPYDYNGAEIQSVLDGMSNSFELAFKNRFLQSHRVDGITDFNIEFSGGCQQIISALDGAYKTLVKVFGEWVEPSSIVIATGLSGVDSSMYTLRLNFFHIFQPSIYLAPVVKEAANQLYNKREIPKKKSPNAAEDDFRSHDFKSIIKRIRNRFSGTIYEKIVCK